MYPQGIAAYPYTFKGCVITEFKICLQFEGCDIKIRPFGQRDEFTKNNKGEKGLMFTEQDKGISILSVGCYMDKLVPLQDELIEAYDKYMLEHSITYFEKTGQNFLTQLERFHEKLGEVIDNANRRFNYVEHVIPDSE